jgi:beta-phosphoglucomutase-like phosphatase (HAD superfamily)
MFSQLRRAVSGSWDTALLNQTYLNLHNLHNLRPHVEYVSARISPDPSLLKPNPQLLTQAITALNVPAETSTLVGDSVTDIQAAHAAGTLSIGYANKPGKRAKLTEVGAHALTVSMADIVKLLLR